MANSPNLYAPKQTDDPKPVSGVETDQKVIARYWKEIDRYASTARKWHEDGEQIERLYLDDEERRDRRMAILWSNIETLKPAVYGKLPAVVCSRRYKDRDPVGRSAAEIMERATNTMLEFARAHETFEMVRDDRLLPGRGTAWVRYESKIGQYPSSADSSKTEGQLNESPSENEQAPAEKLESEYVCLDYVHWKDFGHNVARTWRDVWLVWRCVYMDKEAVTERFGAKIASALKYTVRAPGQGYDSQSANEADDDHERIWEVWDKKRNKVSWICESMKREFMDTGEPPLDFRDFFPCPEPCYATKSSRKLIPRPDYNFYKDQVKEINDLTDKIHNLTGWLIVKGFIPGAPSRINDTLIEAIRDSSNKELIQEVESWQEWTERGGAAKLLDWLPLEMIISAITAAISARNQLIQDIFQITGLSDIIRGESDPNETLGAQTIKAQTSSRRISTTKNRMAQFCRDCAALVAEVIAEKFEPENIAKISGFTYQPQTPVMAPMGGNVLHMPPLAAGSAMQAPPARPMAPNQQPDPSLVFSDDVVALLRDDQMRNFRIEVETDSTVAADMAMDQQRRTEFVNSVGLYLEKVEQAVTTSPELGEVAAQLLMFAMRGFHVGRQMEETVEKAFEAMKQKAQQQAAQPQQDPAAQKAQAQVQATQIKSQSDAQTAMANLQMDRERHQMQMQQDQQRFQMEMAQMQQEFALEIRRMAAEMQQMRIEMGFKMAERQQAAAQNAASQSVVA